MAPPKCRTGTATRMAQMLGRKRESVQLFEGHVGGGFGIRGEIYPEDVLVCAAALKFRKPIKWIEDRREHLIAANHSREQHHKVRAAIDREGQISRIDDEFFHDNGAYMRTHAATVPDLTAAMLPGPYRVPAYRAARPHPAHQQNAVRHLSRARAAMNPPSCASGCSMPSPQKSASIKSKSAGAI